MRTFIFLLAAFTICMACPDTHTAIDCFYEKADMNHDGQISKSELSNAIYSRLSWIERTAFKIFGGLDKIIHDCDQNKDEVLTKHEALLMSHTCMNSCFKKTKTMQLFKCSI